MWRKWKKGIVWLLTVMLVLGAVAGCGKSSEGSPERAYGSEQQVGQSGQKDPEGQEISEDGEKAGEERVRQGAGESDEDESQEDTEESPVEDGQKDIEESEPAADGDGAQIEEDGTYISKDEVALYLHIYGHLPGNYITKKEAQELGWDSKKGNLDEAAPGMSIGGSYFGNYEGMLPEKKGRKYYECDLEYEGGYRGAKRLLYSNDGLIFYTEDHYKTFEQLY